VVDLTQDREWPDRCDQRACGRLGVKWGRSVVALGDILKGALSRSLLIGWFTQGRAPGGVRPTWGQVRSGPRSPCSGTRSRRLIGFQGRARAILTGGGGLLVLCWPAFVLAARLWGDGDLAWTRLRVAWGRSWAPWWPVPVVLVLVAHRCRPRLPFSCCTARFLPAFIIIAPPATNIQRLMSGTERKAVHAAAGVRQRRFE